MRILPTLLTSLIFAAPALAQSVIPDQPAGLVEGQAGETLVLAGGALAVARSYRIENHGEGLVSVGAGAEFYDLRAGNAIDVLIAAAPLQVTFREDAELEFHLVAISPMAE